jgi:hypothetical protein
LKDGIIWLLMDLAMITERRLAIGLNWGVVKLQHPQRTNNFIASFLLPTINQVTQFRLRRRYRIAP